MKRPGENVLHLSVDMDISMDVHGKSVDMDMDGIFHIHGKPANYPPQQCGIWY